MPEIITLHLPENFTGTLERTMRATNQPLEQLLLTALQSALPPLDGLPPDIIADLEVLELLDDDALRRVLLETVPDNIQQELSALLVRQQAHSLSAAEEARLAELQKQADLVMLRKARAAVLLRFRGQRLPTLAELSRLTGFAA